MGGHVPDVARSDPGDLDAHSHDDLLASARVRISGDPRDRSANWR